MSEINLLSQETIDKIAAGEVVERPASVIKELAENAIDAGATAISLEIKGGGIEYIRITDNGKGIDKSEVALAFLRHSTSKLKNAEELSCIGTLGFRGEALSSISAVSRLEMITKRPSDLLGTMYIIEGGIERSLNDTGAPNGTTIIVKDLFFNTPARKKFLKSEATEGSLCLEVIEALALSHPEICFRFSQGGKERLFTPGSGKLIDTVYTVYGRDIAANLLDIDYDDDFLSVKGFIGASSIARGNRNFETFFVGGRLIKSNLLSKACEEGYYGYMMGHQFPFLLLSLKFKNDAVDVNVHPTKQEVRFYDEALVSSTMTQIVHERLTRIVDIAPTPVETIKEPVAFVESAQVLSEIKKESKPATYIADVPPLTPKPVAPFEESKLSAIKASIVESIRKDTPYEHRYKTREEQLSFLSPEVEKEHKIIGQVFDTYWIVEYDGQMFIIDQHAAHEKVLFERTMERLKNHQVSTQNLCPPAIITVTPKEMSDFLEYKEAFETAGFIVEEFGSLELSISGVPDTFTSINYQDLFSELLSSLGSYKASGSMDLIVEKVASMSCKAAVKGNNKLSFAEAKSLIEELMTLENPYHCPHGRPTMISMSEYELSKRFKRII